MALRDVNAVVTITTNAVKAIDDGKKLKQVYADINDQLNQMRADKKTNTPEFKQMQQLAESTKAKINELLRGMELIDKVMGDISGHIGKDLNRALRETSKEFNKTSSATDEGKAKLERLRNVVSDLKRELSDRRGLTMSLKDAEAQLKNLNNASLDKLKQGLAAVREEAAKATDPAKQAQYQQYTKNYEAQIAIKEHGAIGSAPTTGSLKSEDRLRVEGDRQRLVQAYQAVSQSSDAAHQTWANQALKEIQQYNSALSALTETERKDAQVKREQKTAADALAAATKTSDAIARNQKVTIQELVEAQKYYETELKKMEGLNLSPQDQQQVDAMKAKLDAVKLALQDISQTEIKKVFQDIDNQPLETLEATLKKVKEDAATLKLGQDAEIKDAANDIEMLTQAIEKFKEKMAGINDLDFDNLENVPTEKLEAALKRIEEEERKLAGVDADTAQQMAANKTKIVAQLNKNKQATIDYANAEQIAHERGKHSVVEMQAAYDALQQKLLNLRADEHDAIRETQRQMQTLKNDINAVKGEATGLSKIWKTAVRNIATYVGVFAGFNMVKSKIMEIAKESLNLSDSMAQVQKVTGLTAKEVDALNYSLAKLDTRTTLAQLNDLAFSAGKMGLGKYGLEGVEGFVRATNQLQVALGDDLGNSVDEAITPLAKLAENLGLIQKMGVEKSMMAIGSSINELSQTTTAVGANIVDFARRIQPAAQMIGLTTDEILALGSASDSFGISSEISATSFTKFLAAYRTNTAEIERILGMTKGTLDQFFDQGRTIDGLMAIFQRMHDIGDLRYLQDAFKALGSEGSRMFTTFGAFSKNIDMFREHLATSTKAFQEATSVTREFNLVQETAQGLMERSSNIWKNAFVNPEGVDAMKQFAQAWYDVSRSMTSNKAIMAEIKFLLAGIVELIKILVYILPALAGGLTVLGAGRGFVALREALEFSKLSKAVTGLTFSLNGLKAAWTALSAVGRANWIGLIATAVFAAIELFGVFNKKVQEAGVYLKGFKRDLSDLNIEYGKGELELRRYRRAIDETTVGTKQRAAAISQFNSKFKPYLSNLLTEKSTALDVAKAYQEVCKQLRTKMALELRNKDLEEQVKPREQWTAQRREEYDKKAREAGMGQYGSEWITGYAQDNQGKSIDSMIKEIGKRFYNLPDQVVKEISTQAKAGAREFNNYGNIINGKYLNQANALLAAGSYLRQDRSATNTMRQVDKKWASEQKRMEEYLASQEQQTEPIVIEPTDTGGGKGGSESKAPEWMVEEKKNAEKATKAVIASIEEFYRLQEAAANELAANGLLKGADLERMVQYIQDRKDKMLLEARRAIVGDKNSWNTIKMKLDDDLVNRDSEVSREAIKRIQEAEPAKHGEALKKYNGSEEVFGLDSNAYLNDIRKNAAQNELNIQRRQAKMQEEIDKILIQYNYVEQTQRQFGDNLVNLGLITAGYEKVVKQLADGTKITANTQDVQALANKATGMGTRLYDVNFENNESIRKLLGDIFVNENNEREGFADMFPGLPDWISDPQKYRPQIEAFYKLLTDYETRYYEDIKKEHDRQKKVFEERWETSGKGQAYTDVGRAIDREGRRQKMTGEDQGTNFAQMAGFATIGNDPEVQASLLRMAQMQDELEDFKKVNEAKKLEGDALLAYQQGLREKQQAIEDAELAMQETLMSKINDHISKLSQWTEPIQTFATDVGEAMGEAIASGEGMAEAMQNALKGLVKSWGESTIQIVKDLMMQQLKQKLIGKTMVKQEKQTQGEMSNITEEGGKERLSATNLFETGAATVIQNMGQQVLATKQTQDSALAAEDASRVTGETLTGIAGAAARIMETLGPWGAPLIAVVTALLMGLLSAALGALGGGKSSGNNEKAATKVKLKSGMLTYDEGNVQTVVGDDGHVYRAREQASLPEGVKMITSPIATHVNGQQALVGERGPEIVIGRKTTRAIQMNRPDLLRDLALIDRGLTTRKVRTFDDGNIQDLASAIRPTGDGQQTAAIQTTDLTSEDARALTAAIGVFSQTVATLQKNGIPAKIQKYGKGGLIDEVQSGLKFQKRYEG